MIVRADDWPAHGELHYLAQLCIDGGRQEVGHAVVVRAAIHWLFRNGRLQVTEAGQECQIKSPSLANGLSPGEPGDSRLSVLEHTRAERAWSLDNAARAEDWDLGNALI